MKAIHSSNIFPLHLVLQLVLLLYSSPSWSFEVYSEAWLESAKSALESANKTLQSAADQEPDADRLEDIKKKLLPIREQAQDCVAKTEAVAQRRQQDIDSLGSKLSKEANDVSLARVKLDQEREALEKRLAACQFILIQAKDIKEKAGAIEQASLIRKLLVKGPTVRELIQDNLNHPESWWKLSQRFLMTQSGLELLTGADLIALLCSVVLVFFVGRRLYQIWMTSIKKPCVDKCTRFLLALKSCSARLLPVIGASMAAVIFLSYVLPFVPAPFITQLAYGLLSYTLMLGIVGAMLHPDPPASHYLAMDETAAQALAKHLKRLLALGLLGLLFFGSGFSDALLETQYLLARAFYGVFLFLNLVWVLWSIGRIPALGGSYRIRLLLLAALIFALGSEWLGYRNLSIFTLTGLLGSLSGYGIIRFINTLMTDLFDGIDSGYQSWQKRLRRHLGLKDPDPVPGLIWIRLIFSAVIWSGLGLWVLWVWGLSHQGLDLIMTFLQEGFWIGSFRVVPLQIATALLAFSLILAFSGWFKQNVVPGWLSNARIERGARDALLTVTGYLGLTVSLLIALSIAGVEFANIAIIAGALSVGIGFGLQNIVNNFISGLILLIERPIRTGDWILVGATEGFVHRISIRSTQLRTFDGSHIIVPNSELISSQVTNWMLHDSSGRIKIPVSVAYGSDLEKVRAILLAVAHQHDMVITESNRVSAPVVLMTGFGDSALNLELRCFIRSIDNRAQVFSDLCFAINAAFREASIEIPFPQRDVHVK
ncbi:mechanosensitive ion channel domain-containing protein [Methylicorpusculum sp.]|uniref:mechanosensitive ion channel domain-containing protein n=1 Tax=Methylicorpusculum sp. TaxID=2713644 RepID=UPI002ABBD51F|nr:mechanosensitive ion channel domain-containing protein [Methylicorpusculum sp.]MDZ4154753.1 mechanosensitive ion channel [Methylicorpusculum sp.]